MLRLEDTEIPPPQNWQDFEALCHELWKRIWDDPHTQKNGRAGQPQHGVDVFGRIAHSEVYGGVQCKGKSNYESRKFLNDEIESEVEKAKKFLPTLHEFIIASTGKRDQKAQEVARIITQKHAGIGLFSVHIYSWDDIKSELIKHSDVLKLFYPRLFISVSPNGVKEISQGCYLFEINGLDYEDEITKLLNLDKFKHLIVEQLRFDLRDVIIELADNAFRHGKARTCQILIEKRKVSITDNGGGFDPLSASSQNYTAGVGLQYLHLFRQKYAADLMLLYKYDASVNVNVVEFNFQRDLASRGLIKSCLILLRKPFRGRGILDQIAEIPTGCKELYFNVVPGEFNPSLLVPFIKDLLDYIPKEVKLVITFPKDDIKKEIILKVFKGERVEVR